MDNNFEVMYNAAFEKAVERGYTSISRVMRDEKTYYVGYVNASKIIERMQTEGILATEWSQTLPGFEVIRQMPKKSSTDNAGYRR